MVLLIVIENARKRHEANGLVAEVAAPGARPRCPYYFDPVSLFSPWAGAC